MPSDKLESRSVLLTQPKSYSFNQLTLLFLNQCISLNLVQLTRSVNGDSGSGGTRVGTVRLDRLDNVETVSNLTEHNVLAVQPWGGNGGDEELGTVGVWTSVGHGQQTWSVVLLDKVLVLELLTVDGLTASTVTSGEVTTLQHELRDHSVESGVGVTKTLLAGGQRSEVLSGLRNNIVVQFEGNSAELVAVSGNVEVNLGHSGWVEEWKCANTAVFIRFRFFFFAENPMEPMTKSDCTQPVQR